MADLGLGSFGRWLLLNHFRLPLAQRSRLLRFSWCKGDTHSSNTRDIRSTWGSESDEPIPTQTMELA